MLALGIESTCDETAVALVESGRWIRSNVIHSQQKMHEQYGGVVPELASRSHADRIDSLLTRALEEANVLLKEIDLVCVAHGPGLIGALLVGLNAAKAISICLEVPLMGVNHVEAHLYAATMEQTEEIPFPAIGLVLSGGHTALVYMQSIGEYELIGGTVDDAIGEAFDKVAALLGLPYPGGPNVEKLARTGDPGKYRFQAGQVKRSPFDFSFSGLKTNVLYTLKGERAQKNDSVRLDQKEFCHIAASFQESALRDVVYKTKQALAAYPAKALIVGGGVTRNTRLRELFEEADLAIPIYWPPLDLCLDNAAMIAGLGSALYQLGREPATLELRAEPRIKSFRRK